jgi:hypothetical protein
MNILERKDLVSFKTRSTNQISSGKYLLIIQTILVSIEETADIIAKIMTQIVKQTEEYGLEIDFLEINRTFVRHERISHRVCDMKNFTIHD